MRSDCMRMRYETKPHTPPNSNIPIHPPLLVFYSYSWGYRRVFEQYASALHQKYPGLEIEGENYPPTAAKYYISQLINFTKLTLIICIVFGHNPFEMLGMETPAMYTYAMENKVSVPFLLTYWYCFAAKLAGFGGPFSFVHRPMPGYAVGLLSLKLAISRGASLGVLLLTPPCPKDKVIVWVKHLFNVDTDEGVVKDSFIRAGNRTRTGTLPTRLWLWLCAFQWAGGVSVSLAVHLVLPIIWDTAVWLRLLLVVIPKWE